MTLDEIKQKHLRFYLLFWKKSIISKAVIIALMIPATYRIYIEIYSRYNQSYSFQEEVREEFLLPLTIILGVCFSISILLIKTTNFGALFGIKSVQRGFKNDICDYILQQVPEINEIIIEQKIKSSVFDESGLFSERNYDYEGNDWMRGSFKGMNFMISELHIFRLWKNKFNGIFGECILKSTVNDQLYVCDITDHNQEKDFVCPIEIKEIINEHATKWQSSIRIALKNNKLFIAISRNHDFFEFKNKKSINRIDEEFEIFISEINLFKRLIEYF
jgi:hypothetical protein